MSSGARVVLYARISEDPGGEGVGVKRQLDECRELAASRGWEVVAEETDNDISALTGKHRPGYAAVLSLVESGSVDHVIVWQTSRLLRNRRERAEAIELFGRKRVGIITVKGQDLDLSNAYGRGMAGLLGEFDTMESEVKSERIAAAASARAKEGRPNGLLGYGWTTTGTGRAAEFAVNEDEALIVREIVRRLLSGETLRAVTQDLNRRSIPAPARADRWGNTSVKKIATRPANAALRVHHRGRPDETHYAGVWPALVTRDEWQRAVTLLFDPQRRTNAARPGARRHLLTWGIGKCGVCGSRLRVGIKGSSKYGTKQPLYECEAQGCVGRNEARVDELVAEVVIERLSRPDALDWLRPDDEATERLRKEAAELRSRLNDATDRFADGRISADQFDRINQRMASNLAAAEAAYRRAAGSSNLADLEQIAGPKARSEWDARSVTQRRAILTALGMTVLIDRTRRGPGFDPSSVRFEWRTS